IVRREKDIEQIVIGNDRRVERDTDRFGMTGVAAANLLVGRVGGGAADIAAFDAIDTAKRLEHGFGAPEAASGENGGLTGHGICPCWRKRKTPKIVWRVPIPRAAVRRSTSGGRQDLQPVLPASRPFRFRSRRCARCAADAMRRGSADGG